MPSVSRWMIRASLVYLIIGMAIGSLILIEKSYSWFPGIWMLLPVHIEAVIFGWIIQFTMGTAYWILPRLLEGPARGPQSLSYLMVITLNLGIALVILDSLNITDLNLGLPGRMLQLLAIVLFVRLHWNRIVTYRNRS